jgi:hypothetical protein
MASGRSEMMIFQFASVVIKARPGVFELGAQAARLPLSALGEVQQAGHLRSQPWV